GPLQQPLAGSLANTRRGPSAVLLRVPGVRDDSPRKAQILTTSLSAGDTVVFNNRRILHGRTAFPPNERRLLQGCYLENDGLLSRIAVLKRNELHSRDHGAAG